ncbi:hypothetical protein [Streptococcus pluranimalium]|uniref:hypothetical protein n=1 Tax=Streptococcus pluranimalium TaxID=82348 RepID=UPI003F670E17
MLSTHSNVLATYLKLEKLGQLIYVFYKQTNYLMVRCLQSLCRITPSSWTAITWAEVDAIRRR